MTKKHTKGHLGGHCNITHVDIGALEFLVKRFHIQSLLDIGCGPGGQIDAAVGMSLSAEGIDGFPGDMVSPTAKITIHDFADSAPTFLSKSFDLAWSCEFVEHVEEKYVPNYTHCFGLCNVAAITFAPPGKLGHHHVNCRKQEYWIKVFDEYGFDFLPEETEEFKKSSTMKNDFIRKHGLVFLSRKERVT